MLDTTIKSYTTRQAAGVILALSVALALALSGGTSARTTTAGPIGAELRGPARVVDGDTLVVAGTRVRLEGIDAPETSQTCTGADGVGWPCGRMATVVLDRLIGASEVRCEDRGLDKYGRTLGRCFAGARELNAEMVRLGLAWAFVRYSQTYVSVEAEARAAQVGIWQGPSTPPWDYRAGRWQDAETHAPQGCAIKGNVTASGRIYHVPWSPWYEKVNMEAGHGKRWFCSEAEALAAGWRPAHFR